MATLKGCILITLWTVVDGPDNAGREFVFSFMNNEQSLSGFSCTPLDVYVSTSKQGPVFVNVSAPKFTIEKINHQFSITKSQIRRLELNCYLRNFGSMKSSKGLHIEASDEVVVYGVNRQRYCTDGFLALPTDVLGTTYYAVTYSTPGNRKYSNDILVTAVHDDTLVSIRLANNDGVVVDFYGKAYTRNQWINITLAMCDSLQIESFGDLTGSLILSSKNIAMSSGNKKSEIHVDNSQGGVDHLVEQIPPTNTWGKRFVTVSLPGRIAKQIIRIVASKDSTKVIVKSCGYTNNYNLSEGGWIQHIMGASCSSYIRSNKPVLVVQFVHSCVRSNGRISDPAMFMIPPIEQYASDYIVSLPRGTDGAFSNYFLIVMKKSDINGLILDGKRLQSSKLHFHEIDGTDMVGGSLFAGTDTNVHTLNHESQISLFGAVAYGAIRIESYAFPIGMRLASINTPCSQTPMIVADGIDNDCDGLIDEEICYSDHKDDDGDGHINEDCARLNAGITTPKPTRRSHPNHHRHTTTKTRKTHSHFKQTKKTTTTPRTRHTTKTPTTKRRATHATKTPTTKRRTTHTTKTPTTKRRTTHTAKTPTTKRRTTHTAKPPTTKRRTTYTTTYPTTRPTKLTTTKPTTKRPTTHTKISLTTKRRKTHSMTAAQTMAKSTANRKPQKNIKPAIQRSSAKQTANKRVLSKIGPSSKVSKTTATRRTTYISKLSENEQERDLLEVPVWVKHVEVAIITVICCITTGMVACLCRRFAFLGRRKEDEEEERRSLWKSKRRPKPRPRPSTFVDKK